jgi:hypothetical protein
MVKVETVKTEIVNRKMENRKMGLNHRRKMRPTARFLPWREMGKAGREFSPSRP